MTGDLNTTFGHRSIYASRRFHGIMRRTIPAPPIEPAEPLSQTIKGRPAPGNAIKEKVSIEASGFPFGGSAEGNRGMLALIEQCGMYRYVAPSSRFAPKNPVRLHKPFGQLPRWGAKMFCRLT